MLKMLLSCSLWLPLARSCSLRLPIALRICVQHPRSAHKALAQLAAALLRCNTFCCSDKCHEYSYEITTYIQRKLVHNVKNSQGNQLHLVRTTLIPRTRYQFHFRTALRKKISLSWEFELS